MTGDLFGQLAEPEAPAVATFACYCGARDEVREPAPQRVDCWSCRSAKAMQRWTSPHAVPYQSARPYVE